jgi:asparagine synthase (glutamine-hydrolysing)
LKALFEFPQVPRELDTEALNDFLSLNYVPNPRTLVRGITKLSPGCVLEHRRGESRIERYWELDFSRRRKMDVQDASHELDSMLRASVREQLVSDVPSGIWLSGGLDSSTILHYASEAGTCRPKTFSIAFESSSCDERRYFREMAKRYGTDHCEYELGADSDIHAAIEGMTFSSDEPGADAGALPVWFLSKMSAEQVTVALSGEGGDELFGGYTTYLADRIACNLRKVPPVLRTWALRAANRLLPVSDQKISFEYKLKRLLEGSLLTPDDSHLFWNGTFSQRQKADLLVEGASFSPMSEHLMRLAGHREIGRLNRYLLLDQQTYLPDNILYKVDRMSMAHSLEVRPAFLDQRIVEFAASIPEDLKIRGWTTKFILRHTMKDKLPATVRRRAKKGFDIPTHEWMRGVLKPLLLDTLSSDVVTKAGLFDHDAIQMMVAGHLDRKINIGYHLWGLMMLFLWLKRWKIEIPPAVEEIQALPVTVYRTYASLRS